MSDLRLMLVDDHHVVRFGLKALLEREDGILVVGEAGTAAEAIQLAGRIHPTVVLMDIRLPDRSGIEACREIRQRWPAVQVLMLTSFADEELVLQAIGAGAAGYVLKQLDNSELLRAVRAVGHGDAVLDPCVTKQVLNRVRKAEHDARGAAFQELSQREIEILAQVAEGKTNVEIGTVFSLSEKTVRNHVSTILEKLGLSNRIEAATYAVRNHIEQLVAPRAEAEKTTL